MGTSDVRVTFWSSGETEPRTGYGLNTGLIRVKETVRKMEACLQGSNQAWLDCGVLLRPFPVVGAAGFRQEAVTQSTYHKDKPTAQVRLKLCKYLLQFLTWHQTSTPLCLTQDKSHHRSDIGLNKLTLCPCLGSLHQLSPSSPWKK